MALSSILKPECSKCGKLAVELSRTKIGSSTIVKLQCGHLVPEKSFASPNAKYEALISSDGFRLRPYQIDGIKFLEQSDARAILADEQGLGKTIQTLGLLKLHPEKLLPAIIVCPTSVKKQWMHEVYRWCGKNVTFATQIISTSKEIAVPGIGIYIVTYDILKKPEVFEFVDDIKSMFIDECQRIKNHLSERAKAVQKIVSSHKIEHIIPMSGTPIKNNAGEYFTVLNLVRPRRFTTWAGYVRNYCDSYDTGWGTKVGGIKDIEAFKTDTADIILRRTKSEVLKELPTFERKFYHVELDRKLNAAYAKALDDLDDVLYGDDDSFGKSAATIEVMTRMRHITGVSKVEECYDFVTEFLESCDRKIVIFVHHNDVHELLLQRLKLYSEESKSAEPLSLNSSLNGDKRAEVVERFKSNGHRVMIASTLASGEGLNLQFCSDAVMLERQWNPANEEQAEARFHRFGQENPVSVTYMIASGTIDEFFTELVESKRAIVAAALDHKEIQWDQNSLMKDLANVLSSQGRERWKL